MTTEFPSGVYNIQLGNTFLDKERANQNYYTLRFHSKLDPALHSRNTQFRQENDAYITDWIADDNVVSYEGAPGSVQEMECLLIFDEDTQTFTLERPSMKLTMKKVRKKKPAGPPGKPGRKPKSAAAKNATQDTPMDDSFDVDLLRDMDEILNSDDADDDDDDDDGAGSDDDDDDDDDEGFETIDTPTASLSSQQPTPTGRPAPISSSRTPNASIAAAAAGTPGPNSANSANSTNSTNSPGKRRRNVKLASAPIRRLDASPPTPAPASMPSASTPLSASVPNHYHLGQKRPRVAGKSNNMAAMAAQSRAHASDSDSGSSSDDDDDDSTDSSGSEESSSGSDSDDMDAFANDISRGMSDDDQPVASPFMASTVSSSRADQASTTTPSYLKPSPSRTAGHVLTPTMRAGPTSLRDLLGDGAGNREEVSGSSSDED